MLDITSELHELPDGHKLLQFSILTTTYEAEVAIKEDQTGPILVQEILEPRPEYLFLHALKKVNNHTKNLPQVEYYFKLGPNRLIKFSWSGGQKSNNFHVDILGQNILLPTTYLKFKYQYDAGINQHNFSELIFDPFEKLKLNYEISTSAINIHNSYLTTLKIQGLMFELQYPSNIFQSDLSPMKSNNSSWLQTNLQDKFIIKQIPSTEQ